MSRHRFLGSGNLFIGFISVLVDFLDIKIQDGRQNARNGITL